MGQYQLNITQFPHRSASSGNYSFRTIKILKNCEIQRSRNDCGMLLFRIEGMLLFRLPFLQTMPNFSILAKGARVIALLSLMVLLWAGKLYKNRKLFRMRPVSKEDIGVLSLLLQKEEGGSLSQLIARQSPPLKIKNLMAIQKILPLRS